MTMNPMTQTNDDTTRNLLTATHSMGSAGTKPRVQWSDSLGMLASIGCAIHCAAMPFVIGYLPVLGLSFLADEAFHKWMAVACFAIALAAFVPGFRRHGRWTPALIGSVGLAMISIAAFGFSGKCCSSCATAVAAAPALAQPTLAQPTLATPGEACTGACCQGSGAKVEPLSPTLTTTSAAPAAPSPAWLASLLQWITPLGGLVLVVAHLLNHRSGCQSGCC
jgi:hypothetical protein